MPSETLLKSSQTLDREALAAMLESLAGRIRGGQVELSVGDDHVALELPATAKTGVEVTREPKPRGTKLELEVEISWREGEDPVARDLRIA